MAPYLSEQNAHDTGVRVFSVVCVNRPRPPNLVQDMNPMHQRDGDSVVGSCDTKRKQPANISMPVRAGLHFMRANKYCELERRQTPKILLNNFMKDNIFVYKSTCILGLPSAMLA